MIRDFSAAKCYYHTVLLTIKSIDDYHLTFLTSTLIFTTKLLLVTKKQKHVITFY